MASSHQFASKRRRFLIVAIVAAALTSLDARAATSTSNLIEAAEHATLTVVAVVQERAQVDQRRYAAWIKIERTLSGNVGTGDRLRIGWEELASGREPRFADGDRILVALVPPPKLSLWYEVFAEDLQRGQLLTPAAQGTAFMRIPAGTQISTDRFVRYLHAVATRDESGRRTALARMVRLAVAPIALAATERLEALSHDSPLPPPVALALASAAMDRSRPDRVRKRILSATVRANWTELRPALAALSREAGFLRAHALEMLARLDGKLSQELVATLLTDGDARLRTIASRHASSDENLVMAASLVATDPAASVRSAAAIALVEHHGIEAFEEIRPAFSDTDADVNVAVATAIGGLGPVAIESLLRLFEVGTFAEARTAALALAQIDPAGQAALVRLADGADDERKRRLASFAMGRLEAHSH